MAGAPHAIAGGVDVREARRRGEARAARRHDRAAQLALAVRTAEAEAAEAALGAVAAAGDALLREGFAAAVGKAAAAAKAAAAKAAAAKAAGVRRRARRYVARAAAIPQRGRADGRRDGEVDAHGAPRRERWP